MAKIRKKGIELQFHWIFVLIAGGLILAFFFSVAQKQRAISTEKLSLTLSSEVEGIFTGAILAKGTVQTLPLPSQGLAFECSEGCDCAFRIGRASRPFGDKVMFAPSLLKEQDLVVWALDWKLPYRITNFLFITNPTIKYYVVYNEADSISKSLKNELVNTLPEKIDASFITLGEATSLRHEGYAHTKFVFLNTNLITLDDSFKKAEVSAVKIDPQAVYFYYKKPRETSFEAEGVQSYAGVPSLLAALFASDINMYACGLKNAFKKLSYVSELYIKRAEELDEQLQAKTFVEGEEIKVCNYGPIISLLEQQRGLATKLAINLDPRSIAELAALTPQLETQNRALVQQSCPELF